MASSSAVPPLAKYMASTEKSTRDKAIKNLALFLSDPAYEEEGLPKSEMTKLWKGIFYCFWMSDKPLVQQALASELAELVLMIKNTNRALDFVRGFWECTVREWNGIDRLRIDKYYMLLRRFVNVSFRLLARTQFDEAICKSYNDILTCPGGPLYPHDSKIPSGISYHLSDIYLAEFEKVLAQPLDSLSSPPPLSLLFSPFFELAARTPNSTTYKRIHSSVFDPLFAAISPSLEDSDEERPSRKRARLSDDAVSLSSIAKNSKGGEASRLVQRLFEVASEESTRDANRRKMYALWKHVCDDEEDS